MINIYFHSVKFTNYKSIGDYQDSEIIIEPQITAVIGKNESGKSNIIEAISRIEFGSSINGVFHAYNINRNNSYSSENQIKFIVTLRCFEEEQETGLCEDTVIEISQSSQIASGGFVSYINKTAKDSIKRLAVALKSNPFQLQDANYNQFIAFCKSLEFTNQLDILKFTSGLKSIEGWLPKANQTIRGEITEALADVQKKWTEAMNHFPRVFFRNDTRVLQAKYNFEAVQKELQSSTQSANSLLKAFVQLIDVSPDNFMRAIRTGAEGNRVALRDRINRKIEDRFNKGFRRFYSVENITLSATFEANTVSFFVESNDGDKMLLSERSNGFQWYMNTYLDAIANGLGDKRILFLFDEPGIFLHINAQREILGMFSMLCSKGNQVLYSTHSPSMLDMENQGIHRIRAVVKDEKGDTYIYKTPYDSRICPESQEDTLSPILSAIGMSLHYTFGPARDKLNIVTEGMSDYIYIFAMARLLNKDMSRYNLIPANGASNCIDVCNILRGWGCPNIALFDFDNEGVNKGGEVIRKDFLGQLGVDYLYIKDVTQAEIKSGTYRNQTCVIEDLITREEIERFIKTHNIAEKAGKTLCAKLLADALEAGSFQCSEQCKKNFNALLNRIERCCKAKKGAKKYGQNEDGVG